MAKFNVGDKVIVARGHHTFCEAMCEAIGKTFTIREVQDGGAVPYYNFEEPLEGDVWNGYYWTEEALKAVYPFGISKVIFNDPATIVFWTDDTKTIVKCQKGDRYDKELGLAMAIAKKTYGNTGNYNEIFKKFIG